MIVKVRTVKLDTGETTGESHVNWFRRESREWLDRHVSWCMNNGHGVQMWNAKDKEPE